MHVMKCAVILHAYFGLSDGIGFDLSFPIPGPFFLPFAFCKSTVALLGIPFGLEGKKIRGRKRDRLEGEETKLALGWQPTAWAQQPR